MSPVPSPPPDPHSQTITTIFIRLQRHPPAQTALPKVFNIFSVHDPQKHGNYHQHIASTYNGSGVVSTVLQQNITETSHVIVESKWGMPLRDTYSAWLPTNAQCSIRLLYVCRAMNRAFTCDGVRSMPRCSIHTLLFHIFHCGKMSFGVVFRKRSSIII